MFADRGLLAVPQLKATAWGIGLDAAQFDVCLDSNRYADEVTADIEAGRAAGVRATPVIFINGREIPGARPFHEIAEIVEELTAAARELAAAASPAEETDRL
jgi:protein-disulfide isomerase